MKTRAALFILLLTFLIKLGCCSVISFDITPKNPVKGDIITIHGISSPKEKVKVEVRFKKEVVVRGGEYSFPIYGVEIPSGKNKFTVRAYRILDLDVSIRRQIIGGLYTPWITVGKKAVNNFAEISKAAPPGVYDVVIHGKSNSTSVKLEVVAVGYITADENGNFVYSYNTLSMPLGKFEVRVDGITKTVTLAPKKFESSSKSISKSKELNHTKSTLKKIDKDRELHFKELKERQIQKENKTYKQNSKKQVVENSNVTLNLTKNKSIELDFKQTGVSTNNSSKKLEQKYVVRQIESVNENESKNTTVQTIKTDESKQNSKYIPGFEVVLAIAILLLAYLRIRSV